MPTYKNNTSRKIQFQGKVVEPGQEVHTLAYYDEVEIGLYKVHDEPFYNPILIAEQVKENKEIIIPSRDILKKWINKYTIHFHVAEADGNVRVFYNDVKNTPGLLLYKDARWNERCLDRKINKVIIKAEGEFTLDIIVERL